MRRVILDTGPLVALLNANDRHHEWARATLDQVEPPMVTCEAVVSEASFLVRELRGGPDAVLNLLNREIIKVAFSLAQELAAVRKLMQRYASVPMAFADACLVRMSELDEKATVLTVDGDFKIYRRNRRQAIATITPR